MSKKPVMRLGIMLCGDIRQMIIRMGEGKEKSDSRLKVEVVILLDLVHGRHS